MSHPKYFPLSCFTIVFNIFTMNFVLHFHERDIHLKKLLFIIESCRSKKSVMSKTLCCAVCSFIPQRVSRWRRRRRRWRRWKTKMSVHHQSRLLPDRKWQRKTLRTGSTAWSPDQQLINVCVCVEMFLLHFIFLENNLFLVKVTLCRIVAVRGISVAESDGEKVKCCFIASIAFIHILPPSSKEMQFPKATTYKQRAIQ